MCCGILKAAGGLGAIVALILVVIALLKQLILLIGFLLTAIKIAIIVVFVALLLAYEQSLVSDEDLSQVKRAFDLNGWVAIVYFVATGDGGQDRVREEL